ncbi:protein phosphatase 2C domain-containing protein [Niallia sp. XMNu-256]|uniref:protein phosphatase 2C domain-containing protein n=1 Tax=Niallia sp. XMNu-256 TaxID=3082444 RepID=UPI0030CC8E96
MKIEFCTDTVKKSNEDIFGITRFGAFVIDGASALTNKNYTPSGNDVNWMVNWWKKYLEENLDNTLYSIRELLKEGIDCFNNDYEKFVDLSTLKPYEQLSAGIAIVRESEEFLESYVLGDVEITIENGEGEFIAITDPSIKNLDDQVIRMMGRNEKRKDQVVFKDFTQEELDILRRNRSKMNEPGGYFILSHSKEAVDMGRYKTFPVESVERCLLATDGLAPLSMKYTKKSLLDRFREKGAKELIKELRNLEKTDRDLKNIGRLKTHDDATLIYLDFAL